MELIYVCGNKFLITNSLPRTVQLTYRVVGTSESGQLTLREAPGEDPGFSETELETIRSGVVELFYDDARITRQVNDGKDVPSIGKVVRIS